MTAWLDGLYSIPFGVRLLGLCLAFAGIALAERWLRQGRATRAQEYPFWLASALAAGLLGSLVDLVTSHLSREYFVLGKGLPEASASAVASLGFEAGVVAGAVVGGLLLWADNPRPGRAQLGPWRLARELLWPLGLALALAPVGALLGWLLSGSFPADWRASLGPAAPRFALVWGAHAGVYLGALVGTLIGVVRVRRAGRLPQPIPGASVL